MKNVFIIAEAGVNHNGSIDLAKKMIDVAAKAGVDAIKFQTFKAENTISRNAEKADYQKKSTDKSESQFDMVKKLELDLEAHKLLLKYTQFNKIEFLSTPFDLESIDLLDSLGLNVFKIPSGEITNLPYLQKIGGLNKKIILSTGMSCLGEIEDAIDILISNGTEKNNITILQVNTEYPTPMKDANLLAMNTIKEAFKVSVGYSDHSLGIEVPIAAVAMGARVIEKHFTLDKSMEGPDHKASLEPNELEQMVRSIRNIELALGDGIKKPSQSEQQNIKIARKSIHLKHDIKSGNNLTNKDLIMLRPGDGISPMLINKVIGKIIKKDLLSGDKLKWEDLS